MTIKDEPTRHAGESRARLGLGIGLPALVVAIWLVPFLLFRNEVPDPLATHFDGSGTADGSMSVGGFFLTTGIMMAVGLAASVWLAASRKALEAATGAAVAFTGLFIGALAAGILASAMVTQRSAATWEEAGSGWVSVASAILVALPVAMIGARLASMLPTTQDVADSGAAPVMPLAPGEAAVWTGSLHSRWLRYFGITVMLAGVLVATGTRVWVAVPAIVAGIALISLATLHVRADRSGLHVKYGLLPWPRTHVAVDRIETASVIDVRPMRWGGWGYRGSLKLMRQAAVVHRAGPGIHLDLRDGRVFVVTIDNPENPVALLNAEVERGQLASLQ